MGNALVTLGGYRTRRHGCLVLQRLRVSGLCQYYNNGEKSKRERTQRNKEKNEMSEEQEGKTISGWC
jgi:hypothetical protein